MTAAVIINQAFSGLTTAVFLFMTAIGLSLIFGVIRVLNFAHGSFYMLGAYLAYQFTVYLGSSNLGFWASALLAAATAALVGLIVERTLLCRLYGKEELLQLLFTYALVLIFADAVKAIWGIEQVSVSRPPAFSGGVNFAGAVVPQYSLVVSVICMALVLALWVMIQRTRIGRIVRAAAADREMVRALGINVTKLYSSVFAGGCFLAGLGGALVSPVTAINLGMDADIIIASFIAVVVGGMGSFWGTLLGSLLYGQVLAFGILLLPQFSLFAVYALMAVVLIVRPHGLLGVREAARA
ncbi:MAG: branched-chain amino acid ABC transporter permease [Afipia sp.]|nr:branched-chain amino acid ABC transporter permease [Afipia sp.]